MNLYEITTKAIGESYVRSYAWANSEERARQMYMEKYGSLWEILRTRHLFSSTDNEFVTEPNDHGFEEIEG